MIRILGITAIVLVGAMVGTVWYEASFDYSRCKETDKYRQQHQAAWISYNRIGDISVPTIHPARDWTERLYSCPDKNYDYFDKWRTENEAP